MLQRLFQLDQYSNPRKRQQAVYVVTSLFLIGLVYALYAIFIPYDGRSLRLIQVYSQPRFVIALIGAVSFYITAFVALYFVYIGLSQIAAWMTLLAWGVLSTSNVYNSGLLSNFPTIVPLFSVVLGALLIGRNGLIGGFLISMLGYTIVIAARPFVISPDYIRDLQNIIDYSLTDLMEIFIAVTVFSIFVWYFLRYVNIGFQMSLNEAVQARADVGDIVTELTQRVAKRVTVAELSNYTVERIIQAFPKIYHAQIFLTDDNNTEARLFASTGEVGQKLIERAHGLKIGSVSVIGQVTYLGKYVIAKAGSRDSVHQRNELLPETKVEAAFPLRIGDRVIGALDLQSKDDTAFDSADLAQAFQTLADSIGLAIDNIRQYERAEERLKENQRLVEETREALRQVERLNQRLTGRIWSDYIGGAGYAIGASIDFEANKKLTQAELTASLKEAIESQQLVQTTVDDGRQVITVPLRVRGRVVGAMEFELDENDEFMPDDLDLLNEVSDRFGVAVENVRLVNESQRTAQREALVNQIVGRLQTLNNVEDIVTEAAKGLRDALKANKIAIKLGTPPR